MNIKPVAIALADALFPRRCPVCGELPEEGRRICKHCFCRLDFVKEPCCMICGRTVFNETVRLCAECEARPHSFERGCALLCYDDVMRKMVADIKYKNKRSYLEPMGALLCLRYGEQIRAMEADCLIPVPLHPRKFRSRGFNQAELLAREIGRHTAIPVCTDLLLRVRKTEAQKALGAEERIRNLEAAFAVKEREEMPRTAIIVDDIYTTGSTMETCARVLKGAGISRIFFLSLCIVPGF